MMPPRPEEAILRTLLYADIFDYPLTPGEIHHYLIETMTTPEAVHAALDGSPWLATRITRSNGYVAVQGRAAISALRDERKRHSSHLWPQARRWAHLIGGLPFVRMVAVTGALAVDNSPAGDDIDLLIVTAPGRVWLARGLVVALVRVARLFGVGLCPNYVLAQTALAQDRRDLYIAHDIVQMVPLVGHDIYAQMRAANAWAEAYLPHAHGPIRGEAELAPQGLLRVLQGWAERVLAGRLGNVLESWERRRKLRKYLRQASKPGSAAELDVDRVKGHFEDHGGTILREFEARIQHHFHSQNGQSR